MNTKKSVRELVLHGTYREFDKLLFKPVSMMFLGENTKTDGWLRLQYIGDTSSCGKYTSFPPKLIGSAVFHSRQKCLKYMIDKLLEQF